MPEVDDWQPVAQAAPAAADDWQPVRPQAPTSALAESLQAGDNPEAFGGGIPEAFTERLRQGAAMARNVSKLLGSDASMHMLERGAQAASEAYGEGTPTGLSDETVNFLTEHGFFHDPKLGRPGALQLFNEAWSIPTARAFDRLWRAAGAGVAGASGVIGQAAEELTGQPGTAERAQREVENLLNWSMIEGGMPSNFARHTAHGPEAIGDLPKPQEVRTWAQTLGVDKLRTDSIFENLRTLWEQKGVHPAEALHDAQRDAFVRQELVKRDVEPPDRSDVPRVTGSTVADGTPRAELAKTGEAHIDNITDSQPTQEVINNPVVDREHTTPYTAGGSVPLEDPTVFIDYRFPRSFTIDGVTFDPADPFVIHENVEQHTMEALIAGGMDQATAYRVAHFEFAEKAEGAWYAAHGIDKERAEAAYAPFMARIQHEAGDRPVAPNLYKRPYPHDNPSAALREPIAEAKPTAEEIARAKEILAYKPGLRAQGLDPADKVKKEWAQTSPIKTIDDLFARAKENQDELGRVGDQVQAELGAGVKFMNPGVKGRPRTQEKIDEGKAPGKINDVVRAGFVVELPAQADQIVQRLAQHFQVADEGWFVTPAGYFDRKVILRFRNGQGGEIQLWHPDMLRAKEEKGHHLYVEWRNLPKDDPQRAVLDQRMREIYEGALTDAAPEWKALVGKGGTDGYLASNAALESTRPSIDTTASLAGVQRSLESSLTDQALTQPGPLASTKGSPSQEPYTTVGERASETITPNIDTARREGETDKQFAKRVVDKREPPKTLPEDYEKYFNIDDRTVVVPMDKLVSGKTAEENVQGGENGAKRMAAAAAGELSRRDPITVSRQAGGKYLVVDGNGTLTSVKKYGWQAMPVHVVEDAAEQEAKQAVKAPEPIQSEIANGVTAFRPDELTVDAARFQFKEGGDEAGVTDRLKGVTKWDPIKAGMVLAWEDEKGQRFIVDGHQRLGLAKRIAAADPAQNPRLNGYLLKATEGVSDVEARVVAAAKNIAEGTGTAVDAAKILRDRPALLDELPPRSELVKQARSLAQLEDGAFRMVVNGVVPPNYAAVVGRLAPGDGKLQGALLELLAKTEPENVTQAEAIVRQGIEAGRHVETQQGLFGEEEVTSSLYLERAKVLDRSLKQIRRDKTVFSTLVREAETIEAAGSKLAHDVNERRATADAQALQILQTLANRTGPISDALNAAARRAKSSGSYAGAVQEFVATIRQSAESGDLARLANGERGGLENAGGQDPTGLVERAPTIEPGLEAEATAKTTAIVDQILKTEATPQGQQFIFPGTEESARQLAAAREAAGGGMLRGEVPQEAPGGLFAPQEAPQPGLFGAAAGADVTRPESLPSLQTQPAPRPGSLLAGIRDIGAQLFDIGKDLQMLVAPMAAGSKAAMALAKDFANAVRRNRWEWARVDQDIVRRFNPEQRKRMWDAADEESVAIQLGESREHQGLVTLEPEERRAVEDLQRRAQIAWGRARDLDMVEGEGLPAYTPRMVINAAAGDGKVRALNSIGGNLRTTTGQLLRREYMTAEETEAAAKESLGEGAVIARDIRSLPLATAKLEDAIAGRTLINAIKEYGKRTGDETVVEGAKPVGSDQKWFTIEQHPAFWTWRPKLEEVDRGAAGGPAEIGWEAKKDEDGNVIFEKVPLYIRGDFEGPLRAVLTKPSGPFYGALMAIKGKTMGLIMNSPLIHNAVEWGRALPAMPGKVATFRVYFEGNRVKNDVAQMTEAIEAGLVPIGKRFFNQDISSIMEEPNLTPGRSWSAKVLGFVPGLFDPAAGAAVKTAIDRAGDFWHNTLLWDRVGDLQMGLYANFRDDMVAKGVDRQTAARVAAQWANRYAGALPQEAMSDGARKVSNFLMFSRSFTLGNLGVMKDMLTGLPKDVLAQIERDAGEVNPEAVGYAKAMARRKAIAVVALDMGLMYVGNSILQSALTVLRGDNTLDQEMHGYTARLSNELQKTKENPLSLLTPLSVAGAGIGGVSGFAAGGIPGAVAGAAIGGLAGTGMSAASRLSSLASNEPGKEDRVLIGHAGDGTGIYARNPVGKIGEEFEGYFTGPLDMIRRKLGTVARPGLQILENDAGFGRKVYDPTTDKFDLAKDIKIIGQIAEHLAGSQLPEGQISAGADLVRGEGDPKVNAFGFFGPIAGITTSKGAPGGPAVGELYNAKAMHEYAVDAALPDIRRQIQRGDIMGARSRMTELGVPPGLQNFYVRTTINPATRLGGRTLRDFYLYGTDEQKQRLENAR